jgi:hypothetical protein
MVPQDLKNSDFFKGLSIVVLILAVAAVVSNYYNQRQTEQRIEQIVATFSENEEREVQRSAYGKNADALFKINSLADRDIWNNGVKFIHLSGTDIKIPTPPDYVEIAEIHPDWSTAYKRAKFDGINKVFLTYMKEEWQPQESGLGLHL